jgi:hypothetical protein
MSRKQFPHKCIILTIMTIAGLCSTQTAWAGDPSSQTLELSNPYWRVLWIDAAGYSDMFYWGRSPRHDFDEHEMLWGEWANLV